MKGNMYLQHMMTIVMRAYMNTMMMIIRKTTM